MNTVQEIKARYEARQEAEMDVLIDALSDKMRENQKRRFAEERRKAIRAMRKQKVIRLASCVGLLGVQ